MSDEAELDAGGRMKDGEKQDDEQPAFTPSCIRHPSSKDE